MKNILIVEDESFLIQALEDNFVAESYAVEIAKNGEEAIEKIAVKQPDIILLDILMPKKDGFYVLDKLKKDPYWKKIPVIVLSNLGEDVAVDKAMAMGATDYFVKSDFSIGKIVKKIRGYLK